MLAPDLVQDWTLALWVSEFDSPALKAWDKCLWADLKQSLDIFTGTSSEAEMNLLLTPLGGTFLVGCLDPHPPDPRPSVSVSVHHGFVSRKPSSGSPASSHTFWSISQLFRGWFASTWSRVPAYIWRAARELRRWGIRPVSPEEMNFTGWMLFNIISADKQAGRNSLRKKDSKRFPNADGCLMGLIHTCACVFL